MGFMCSTLGCAEEPINFWGDDASYVLFRCSRCKKESIFCSKEKMVLKNTPEDHKVRDLMLSDPEFSKQCTIYSEFLAAKTGKFSSAKVEKEYDIIRQKYGLPFNYVPQDPVDQYRRGFWVRQTPKKPKKKTQSIDKPINIDDDGSGYLSVTFLIRQEDFERIKSEELPDSHYEEMLFSRNKRSTTPPPMTDEEKIARMEKRLKHHIEKEEYEKAAKLRDKIDRLKNDHK